MTRERPILFSAPMVRAILAGTKTQTRRSVKPQPLGGAPTLLEHLLPHQRWATDEAEEEYVWKCPYGEPGARGRRPVRSVWRSLRFSVGGSRLWVREAWAAPHAYDHLPPRLIPQDARIHYAATEERGGLRWRPSIHMPRWASRITLEITGVRVERLQEISEADAVAEGTPCYVCGRVMDGLGEDDCHCFHTKARPSDYRALWEQINGPGSWDANPWVWVIKFRKLERQ